MTRQAKASFAGSNLEPARRSGIFALLSLVLAVAMALFASPALAGETHLYTGTSFGPEGTAGSGTFAHVQGVAVDQTSGSVYVHDSPEGKIYKFDSSGEPAAFSSLSGNAIAETGGAANGENELAVAPAGSPGGTAGDIYLANGREVRIYAPSGAALGTLASGEGEVCGVATSPSGHVFVGIFPSTVREYVPAANPVTNADLATTSIASLPSICNVAADGLGNVYAANYNGGSGAVKLEGIADPAAEAIDPAASTMTVDPATNDFYADRGGSVFQYDSAGNPVGSFGSELLTGSHGIAVNSSSGKVYVGGGASGRVAIFGAGVVTPSVSAQGAGGINATVATLNGTINPSGLAVAECKFEYGASAAYGSTKPCEGAIPTDGNDHPVTAALTGLEPGTTYHFRVVATNANGASVSADETFTTFQPASTEAATAVSGHKATLNGTVLPKGEAVSECFFQYGASVNYGKKATCEGAIPTDEGAHPVTAALTGLASGSTYHFRLVVVRGTGTARGVDMSFTTDIPVVTGGSSAIAPPTADVEGTVNPEGGTVSACSFEFGITKTYGQSVPCTESSGTIGSGESPVPVHATLTGLGFGTEYHYRLVATSTNGVAHGGDQSFLTTGPVIEATHASFVSRAEATLEAKINPKGAPTSYHIEYGTSDSYGISTPETFVDEDNSGHFVTEQLVELTPGETYHFRVVATSSVGTSFSPDRVFTTSALPIPPQTECPNQVFRVGLGANLPDCRAYEQATPTDKHGANATGTFNLVQASRSGKRITFADPGGLPSTGGSTSAPVYVASRGASGWSSNGLLAQNIGSGRVELLGWDEEIDGSVSQQSRSGIFLGDTASETFERTLPISDPFEAFLGGFTEDPSHLILESENQFISGAVSGHSNIYDLDHGALSLVDRIPASGAATCDDTGGPACVTAPEGAFVGPYNWQGGEGLSNGGSHMHYYTKDAVSKDGSKVFFTTAGDGQLYVREGGTTTSRVSASQAGALDPNGRKPAAFMDATPSGSQVFFASCEKLTDDSTAVSTPEPTCTGQEQGQDLYSYDTQSGSLTDLTVDSSESDPRGAAVVGVLGTSGDGSYVYFAANGVLAPGAEAGNCTSASFGEGEECSVYVYHAGTVGFVARLAGCSEGCDALNWLARMHVDTSKAKTSRVAPNGILLLTAKTDLTGYENVPAGDGNNPCGATKGSCNEIFRFDPASEELSCVSCNPTGASPTGSATFESQREVYETRPQVSLLTRNISSDGNRVFFDTRDPLVPEDTNGVRDAYEWEADGSGSCKSTAADGGCLYLLSSGTSPFPSYLGDNSASGDDAFIFTDQSLVPTDKDQLTDVYDVRVDGGLASQNPSPAAPPCEGEACKGPSSVAPAESSPGSASFSGPGNQHTQAHAKKKKCGKHGKKCKQKKSRGAKKHRGAHRNSGGSK